MRDRQTDRHRKQNRKILTETERKCGYCPNMDLNARTAHPACKPYTYQASLSGTFPWKQRILYVQTDAFQFARKLSAKISLLSNLLGLE